MLNVIINGFLAMCPKKRISAAEFANDNTYGKMVAILDQIVYMVGLSVDAHRTGSILSVGYRHCGRARQDEECLIELLLALSVFTLPYHPNKQHHTASARKWV